MRQWRQYDIGSPVNLASIEQVLFPFAYSFCVGIKIPRNRISVSYKYEYLVQISVLQSFWIQNGDLTTISHSRSSTFHRVAETAVCYNKQINDPDKVLLFFY